MTELEQDRIELFRKELHDWWDDANANSDAEYALANLKIDFSNLFPPPPRPKDALKLFRTELDAAILRQSDTMPDDWNEGLKYARNIFNDMVKEAAK